ncbi:MAG: hypothetical protein ACKOPP_00495, partial [Bacteroidota bacterium]
MNRGVLLGLFLVATFLAWCYPKLLRSPDDLATEAAAYLQDQLPSLHRTAQSWSAKHGEPPAGFELVVLDSKGQRLSWSGRGLLTTVATKLGVLRGFPPVDVQHRQGLGGVTATESG